MKTNLIEIQVSGKTSSGKTEVCKVISDALLNYYGRHTQVASRVLSEEESSAAVSIFEDAKITGQTAKRSNTVFVIMENNHE